MLFSDYIEQKELRLLFLWAVEEGLALAIPDGEPQALAMVNLFQDSVFSFG